MAEPARAGTSLPEEQFHAMVNAVRENHSLRLMDLSGRLSRLAGRHSRRMAEQGALFHSDLSRFLSYEIQAVGENVGYAFSLEQMLDAFMDSPGHRHNLMGRWNRTGIGIVQQGDALWVTQIFSR